MKFQNPFVVSAADVSAGTAYTVDLTFNPDNLIRGFAAPNGPSNLSLVDGTLGASTTNSINVPELDLGPVPRKSTDKTIVESYTTTLITGMTDTFTLRLELYYNSSDTAKTIYGATLRVIPVAASPSGRRISRRSPSSRTTQPIRPSSISRTTRRTRSSPASAEGRAWAIRRPLPCPARGRTTRPFWHRPAALRAGH